jgi:hypothetical protein
MSKQPAEENAAFKTLFRRLMKCRDEYHKLYMEFINLNTDREFTSAPLPLPFAQNIKESSISHSKEDLDRMTSKELTQLIEDNGLSAKVILPAEKKDLVDILLDYYGIKTSKGGKRRSTNRKKTNKRRRSSKRRSSIRNWFSL